MIKELDKIGFVLLCLAFILGLFFMTCGNRQEKVVEEINAEEQKLLDSIEMEYSKSDSIVLYFDYFDSNGKPISGGVVYKNEYESIMK